MTGKKQDSISANSTLALVLAATWVPILCAPTAAVLQHVLTHLGGYSLAGLGAAHSCLALGCSSSSSLLDSWLSSWLQLLQQAQTSINKQKMRQVQAEDGPWTEICVMVVNQQDTISVPVSAAAWVHKGRAYNWAQLPQAIARTNIPAAQRPTRPHQALQVGHRLQPQPQPQPQPFPQTC